MAHLLPPGYSFIQPHKRRAVNNEPTSAIFERIQRERLQMHAEANSGTFVSGINWVIMDYLITEGYPTAAEKFAQESNLQPADLDGIRERVKIRQAIHGGSIDEAIGMINNIDPEILDTNPHLHFDLLQLQLIEIIRAVLDRHSHQAPAAQDFKGAIDFATEQLAPRAPTDSRYQHALEETMALLVYPVDKMPPEFKKLLDVRLREKVASDTNKAILEADGKKPEAKIRSLVRARAWAAENSAQPAFRDEPIGLDDPASEANGRTRMDGDAIMT